MIVVYRNLNLVKGECIAVRNLGFRERGFPFYLE